MVNNLAELEEGLKSLCECDMLCKQNNKQDKDTLKTLGVDDFYQYVKNTDIKQITEDIKTKFTDKNDYYYIGKRIHNTLSAYVDEAIFTDNECVTANPDKTSKEYDFIIKNDNGEFMYDLKSTRLKQYGVFKDFSNNLKKIKSDPRTLVGLFYENQSVGARYSIQNRLFLILMSEIDQSVKHLNEVKIRFAEKKEKVNKLISKIENKHKIPFRGLHKKLNKYVECYATIAVINEKIDGELECYLISDKN